MGRNQRMGSVPLAIIDLDGVVADVRHRLHHLRQRPKDWDAFFDAARLDRAYEEGVDLVRRLADDHEVVFLSGRPERCREETVSWLARHGLGGHQVVLRPGGDRRPAAVVKVELVRRLAKGRTVAVVVDDDPLVIAAMKQAGYPVHRADWEDRTSVGEQALFEAQEVEGRT